MVTATVTRNTVSLWETLQIVSYRPKANTLYSCEMCPFGVKLGKIVMDFTYFKDFLLARKIWFMDIAHVW